MKEQRIEYNVKTGIIEIIEEIVEEIVETEKVIEETIDEKIMNLQNVDTDHEMAIVELANMIIDLTGGETNA